jgi:hypothetical protein
MARKMTESAVRLFNLNTEREDSLVLYAFCAHPVIGTDDSIVDVDMSQNNTISHG